MSTTSQVKENVASADSSSPNKLSKEDLSIIDKVREQYEKLSPIFCTNCRYCMSCPNGVEIPQIFRLYNEGFMYEDHRRSRFFYRELPKDNQAKECNKCHEFEEKCPQKLPIPEWLEKAHKWLGPKNG
ncbi:MAG: 4Fe-4S dicluster domain-containing protein [Halobacteriota archaeon]|nr:4Fe-4S dicluster domain-containing protein [Halobacteriota archaeon]